MRKAKFDPDETLVVPNDKLMGYTRFAHFCINCRIAPFDLAQLIALAKTRHNAEVKICNGDQSERTKRREAKARHEFELLAKHYKLKVTWPSLCPDLTYKGRTVRLPDPF
jgi:hypothetical protein